MSNEAEIIIESIKDIFEIATSGFDAFYHSADSNITGDSSKSASSGDCSTSASSGDSSTSASSGNYSKSASSGDYSKSASSGDSSTSASSGDCSTSASSGNYSKSASSGHSSKSASSGDCSTSASSGYYSKSASSGDYSASASSGHFSTSASSGDSSTSASSGNYSKSASSGNYSKSASSGHSSKSASSGDYSTSASSGDSSKSASSGNYSKSASSGNYSTSASSGKHASTSALGYRAAVKGELGNLLMCSEFILEKGTAIPIGGKASLVDGKILKPNRWYIVEQGEWVEVDFTDNIFSYVLTTKKGVKKVRLENGTINFIVYDNEGNAAHGTSIEEARKDLIYKKTVKFDGKVPEHATGEEWVGLYRTITGSCIVGIKSFVESMQLDLSKVYSSKEVCEIIVGQYGSEQFIEKAKGDV